MATLTLDPKKLSNRERKHTDRYIRKYGATPAVVQKQLRHSDPRITLGVYAHVIGDQQRSAVENRSARIEQYAAN